MTRWPRQAVTVTTTVTKGRGQRLSDGDTLSWPALLHGDNNPWPAIFLLQATLSQVAEPPSPQGRPGRRSLWRTDAHSMRARSPLTQPMEHTMAARNWDRPSFRTRGRTTESITGSDMPSEFRTTPRMPRPKADLRREAEQAVRAFIEQQAVKTDAPAPPPHDRKPPWEDD